MSSSTHSKSNQSSLDNGDPNRARARLLAKLLNTCGHCHSGVQGHEFALIATWIVTKEIDNALVKFFEATKEHQWPKLREFQSWRGRSDNLEAYAIRCPGQNLSVAIIKTHFELLQGARLLYSEALSTEEGDKLLSAFQVFGGSRSERTWFSQQTTVL